MFYTNTLPLPLISVAWLTDTVAIIDLLSKLGYRLDALVGMHQLKTAMERFICFLKCTRVCFDCIKCLFSGSRETPPAFVSWQKSFPPQGRVKHNFCPWFLTPIELVCLYHLLNMISATSCHGSLKIHVLAHTIFYISDKPHLLVLFKTMADMLLPFPWCPTSIP